MRPVLVHGGGAAITRAMATAGLEPRFSPGTAVTPTTPRWPSSNGSWPAKSTSGLARQIEDYGGKAQSLNFRTTNVLLGEQLKLDGSERRTDRPGPRRHGDFGRRRDHPPALRGWAGAGHSLDVRRCPWPEAERQCRHGRHGRRPVPASREDGLPQRRERRPPRQERSQVPDRLAHGPAGPRVDFQRGDRIGHDSQGAGLPGHSRSGRSQGPHYRRPPAARACCWKCSPAKASARKLSRTENCDRGQDCEEENLGDVICLEFRRRAEAVPAVRHSQLRPLSGCPGAAARVRIFGTPKETAIWTSFPAGDAGCWAIAPARSWRPSASSWGA